MRCSTTSQCRASALVPEPHSFWSKTLLLANSLEVSVACQMLLCICVPFIVSISLIVGMRYPSMLTINIHILIQVITELLWEDELSSMGILIKYSYHYAVSRIHPIIPDESTTSSKKQERGFDLVENERQRHSCCFIFSGE